MGELNNRSSFIDDILGPPVTEEEIKKYNLDLTSCIDLRVLRNRAKREEEKKTITD